MALETRVELEHQEDGFYWENIYFGGAERNASETANRFEEYLNDRGPQYLDAFQREGRLKHLIETNQFTSELLARICEVADVISSIAMIDAGKFAPYVALNKRPIQGPTLKNVLPVKMALNLFGQPSTRTHASFEAAQALLGMSSTTVHSTDSTSMKKGESLTDTLESFSSTHDLIVARHPSNFFPQFAAFVVERPYTEIVPIINAGCGNYDHPTQALLDYYTIYKRFDGEVEGKRIMFMGDCSARTVNSLAKTLSLTGVVEMYFAASDDKQASDSLLNDLHEKGVNTAKITPSGSEYEIKWEKELPEVDIVYVVRDQQGISTHTPSIRFEPYHLRYLPNDAVVLHPLPRTDEMSTAVDVERSGKVMYRAQMESGKWVRAALIAYIFGHDEAILNYKPLLS